MSDIDNTNSMRDFMPSDTNLNDTPETGEVGTPDVQAESDTTSQPQTQEPSFTESFDPSKLPPELQVAYKQMQGDYTRKTQELAEARKFHETYAQYAPLLDFIAQNPQIAEAYMSGQMVQPDQETDAQSEVTYSDDPVEFAKQLKEEAKREAIAEFMNFYNEQKQIEEAESRLIADADEASTIDPRLNTDEEFSDQVVGIMALDKDFIAGRKTAVQATREAIAKVDAYTNRRLESEKQKLSELAKAKRSPASVSSPRPTISQDQAPKTMREAAAEFLN